MNTATKIQLLEEQIDYILVQYNGGGDSGTIETIQGFSTNRVISDQEMQENCIGGHNGMMNLIGSFLTSEIDISSDLYGKLEDVALEHLNTVEEWCNGDGGFGTMLIRASDLYFVNDHNTYKIEYDTFNHDGNLQFHEDE